MAWEMEAKLPVVAVMPRRVTGRVDETLSSLLVIAIAPDPAVLVVIMQPPFQRLSLHVADDAQE